MKQILFSFLFLPLFVACDSSASEEDPMAILENNVSLQEETLFKENKTFDIRNGGELLIYLGRIGYDFDSALDSLKNSYEPLLNTLAKEGHYSGEGYDITKEKMDVNFVYDNREFTLLTFIDKANVYQYLITCEVIDSKGNNYRLVPPED